MDKIVKQVVGIDVAQKELVVCFGRLSEDFTVEMHAYKAFRNTSKGFGELTRWVHKLTNPEVSLRFVMEATGVYHEPLAYFLEAAGYAISIVLPNKISNYFKTLEVKTVTDKTMAETITHFGLERKLESWQRPKAIFKKLRQLTRERDQLVQERTMVKNQLHAEGAEAEPNASSVARIKKRIALLDKQEKEILEEISKLVKQDEQIKQTAEIICSLPGVGLLTAATVLAETNGFELIRNKRQLSSYAGLDVKEKQSGTSIKGKPRISKKGNTYLRKAMHLPALTAIRHDEGFKAIFIRLVSKHGIKMKAVVAIQRRLLEMIYILYKNKAVYDKEYYKKANLLQEMIA
ncbi:IS110 family transposase [Chitinophagaceae bacterium LB-8]|uniref:IS110 family transposase n=1 Tax=Paraflavisolibacter caeni TaxID=2982496 RepID=A0A9X2XV15_9BACT|nr:IS110 family transposase [Paraflavisolibacter caeni]MCU7549190.1 IS110 family transposase [Paraflavisolibacter caeni]